MAEKEKKETVDVFPSNLMEKLIYIQNALYVPKGKTKQNDRFKYRTAEAIENAVKPHLMKLRVLMLLEDDVVCIEGAYYLRSIVMVTDGTDTYRTKGMAREAVGTKNMDPSQATGSASSYARKKALEGMFIVSDESEDPDNDRRNTDGTYDHSVPPKQTKQRRKDSPLEQARNALFATINGRPDKAELIEQIKAESAKLTAEQKVGYFATKCQSLMVEPSDSVFTDEVPFEGV